MYRTILAMAAAALLTGCFSESESPPPKPESESIIERVEDVFEGEPKAAPAPKPESALGKIEDKAERLLDEIEGKSEKE